MRKFALLLLAVLLVAGAWAGGWYFAAGEVRKLVASLGEGDGEANPKITCGTLDVTGFPFRFDLACTDAMLVSGDVTATIAGLKASLLAYNPTHLRFSALAPVSLEDAFTGSRSRIDFSAADGSLRLVTDDLWKGLQGEGWRIGRASLVADGIEWTDTVVDEKPIASATHLEAHLIDIPEQLDATAGTAALAAYARLEDAAAPGLAVADGETSLEAELSGLPDDLMALADPSLLERWQEAGGQLKLVGLRGTAGEDFVESSGTLALDSAARLEGQLQLASKGLVERTGTLLPEDWKGLILGGPAEDGSYRQTVTIKAGVVFSGLMPVMMIPPLL